MVKIVEPCFEFVKPHQDPKQDIKFLELVARNAYKSEDKITDDSADKLIRRLVKMGHHGILEHVTVSLRLFMSRASTHQLVRHRMGSYVERSLRYVKLDEIEAVVPNKIKQADRIVLDTWINSVQSSFDIYKNLISKGIKPEDARSILPLATLSEVIVTFNLRQWRNFLALRTEIHAQEEIRELSKDILKYMKEEYECVFFDIGE